MPIRPDFHSLLLFICRSAAVALVAVCLAMSLPAQSGRRINKQPARPDQNHTVTSDAVTKETVTSDAVTSDAVTIRTTEILLKVTVRDSLGQAVDGLKAEDFFIYDNGRRYEPLHFEQPQKRVDVVLLLENADGFLQESETIKNALLSFQQALKPSDRVAVMRFSDEIVLHQDWSNDRMMLAQTLKRGKRGGSKAAIYDALILAAAKLSETDDGRRAVVLLTSGLNTAGAANSGDALAALQSVDAPVYILSETEAIASALRQLQTKKLTQTASGANTSANATSLHLLETAELELTSLAEQSGGIIYFPLREGSLSWMLAQVADELRMQYQVSYQPAGDGDWTSEAHRIEVLVRGGHQTQAHPASTRHKPNFNSRFTAEIHNH